MNVCSEVSGGNDVPELLLSDSSRGFGHEDIIGNSSLQLSAAGQKPLRQPQPWPTRFEMTQVQNVQERD